MRGCSRRMRRRRHGRASVGRDDPGVAAGPVGRPTLELSFEIRCEASPRSSVPGASKSGGTKRVTPARCRAWSPGESLPSPESSSANTWEDASSFSAEFTATPFVLVVGMRYAFAGATADGLWLQASALLLELGVPSGTRGLLVRNTYSTGNLSGNGLFLTSWTSDASRTVADSRASTDPTRLCPRWIKTGSMARCAGPVTRLPPGPQGPRRSGAGLRPERDHESTSFHGCRGCSQERS